MRSNFFSRGESQPGARRRLRVLGGVVAAWSILLAVASGSLARAETASVEAAVKKVEVVIARGPYQATWESLQKYEVPEWYLDAKFGIFIHWGVYSVPAFGNEWYPRNMYKRDEHRRVQTPSSRPTGRSRSSATRISSPASRRRSSMPTRWAELFKKAGAKYVVPVAEHHDGFPMYDCSFTDWNAAKMGPKRDIVGELAAAVRKQGLHFGASSHRAEHWWFFDGGMQFDSDVKDPRYAGLYGPAAAGERPSPTRRSWTTGWRAPAEIVDKYQPQTRLVRLVDRAAGV